MSLLKPKEGFFSKLKNFFVGKPITDELYEELEEMLIKSDIGINTTLSIISELEEKKPKTSEQAYMYLEQILCEKLTNLDNTKLQLSKNTLNVILVVGVNGVGKTTSIGKLTHYLKNMGYSVVLGAGDTFRAAAIEQLELWGQRSNTKVISHGKGKDPASVVFDTIAYAKSENIDVAIIDTAGRLHNKKDLMVELEKIKKIIVNKSGVPECETLLVVDATTGQNGLEQAKIFNEITKLSGIILTKYDGTAKGGIIFPIIEEIKRPIKFIGLGEGIDDLKEFDAISFVKEIFEK